MSFEELIDKWKAEPLEQYGSITYRCEVLQRRIAALDDADGRTDHEIQALKVILVDAITVLASVAVEARV